MANEIAEIEKAIVAATLAGRHATADLLADRLRARLASAEANVVALKPRRPKR